MGAWALKILYVLIAITLLGYGGVWLGSEVRLRNVDPPQPFTTGIEYDAESLKYGKHLARTRGCFGCHGQNLEGRVFTEQWPWVERAVAPNLVIFAQQHSPSVLEAAIRHGIGSDGKALWSMPSYNWTNLKDQDLANLIAYLQSESSVAVALPEPALGFSARWSIAFGQDQHMAELASSVPALQYSSSKNLVMQRGEYIAKTTCNECHGLDLKGSIQPDFVSPSLEIIAAYNEDQFRVLMKEGRSNSGRENLGLMTVIAKDRFAFFTDRELSDLYHYLRTFADG
jgi:mono/diheme cytochrome c family protein